MSALPDVADLIKKHFHFVIDHGFRVVKQSRDSGWAEIRYRKASLGIIVTFEGRDQSVFVELCRLTEGKFPSKPTERLVSGDRVEIAYLLAVRAPDRIVRGYRRGEPPPVGGLEGIMEAQAANLREYAADFLDGDSSVLDLAMPGLRQRAEEVRKEKWVDSSRHGGPGDSGGPS